MAQLDKRVIRDASVWFSRMHGPDPADHQAAFNAWMASDAHRDAYSRVSEAFSLGKNLPRHSSLSHENITRSSKLGRWKLVATIALLTSTVGIALVTIERHDSVSPRSQVAFNTTTTRVGQIRTLRLGDGSIVTLDTDSQLTTRFTPTSRDLWLLRGRGRFDVAHEGRPFVVHAGNGTVTAHGTVFDVRVRANKVLVQLIRGAIDVKLSQHMHRPAMVRRVPAPHCCGSSQPS